MIKSFLILLLLHAFLLFSQNQSQYPDVIIDSYNSTTKTKDVFYGGSKVPSRKTVIALDSLFYKNDCFISLPQGSFVVVGFTNNYIIDAPNQNDIFIEEVGGAGEYADVFVSSDNVQYTLLGIAGNGSVNEFDLATIAYKKQVKFIKIIGKDNKGSSPGFDLGSVYGLPGANKYEEVVILESVLFQTNKSVLLEQSFASLDKLALQLLTNKSIKIEIRGHTDNVGKEAKNKLLSEQRAKAVLNYLVSKGIDANRFTYNGFGSLQPIASNDTEEGRNKNRRVEFLKTE
ncbi:OmpA family protein [Flavobacterium buctense]|uniref:OmpA family protein n=1 Tax=Flavobacterium buctense TaxID=1648146 RepID=A0ABU9E0I7_9FLAO|nr:OmpA family protein [Flavobacterium buctense]